MGLYKRNRGQRMREAIYRIVVLVALLHSVVGNHGTNTTPKDLFSNSPSTLVIPSTLLHSVSRVNSNGSPTTPFKVTLTTSPSIVPTINFEQYKVMTSGTSHCVDGYEPIPSHAACEAFANDTKGLAYIDSQSMDFGPKGCISSGVKVYFNTNPDGSAHSTISLVCQLMTPLLSASPSYLPSRKLPFDQPTVSVVSSFLCPAGTFSNNKTAIDFCFECPKGTYQDKSGKSECIVCNSTAYQNQTGQSSCDNCLPGTYPDPSKSSCLECPKGTYSTAVDPECSKCAVGSVQNRTGQSSCEICQSGTYSDQSRVSCIDCPYRLGSEDNSDKCPFCGDGFYLRIPSIDPERLVEDPANFCLYCPPHAHCEMNTTIETLKGTPGFWRDSNRTGAYYECNDIAGVCLGGTTCLRDHSGARCEVCVKRHEYFDSSKGECVKCPYSRLATSSGIIVGIILFFLCLRIILHRHEETERLMARIFFSFKAMGIQAKFKICLSFLQVVATLDPVYGVQFHNAFLSWFEVLNLFDFGLDSLLGVPMRCVPSMKIRLLLGAGWPFALALMLISGLLVYMIAIDMRKLERKDALSKFMLRSLRVVIIIFYFVLPSVCRKIFDARTCESFQTNDSENESSSYLIADWSVQCENGNSDYEGIQHVFWAVFAIWPVGVPVGCFALILIIRPSVQSNSITPLADGCQFLWFDYSGDMMFWEVIDMVRKICLTGLMIFIDTEEGSERILRLIIAIGICILYGNILSLARPYRRKDDNHLAILSNLFLTCYFLVGIIIHQCKDDEDMDAGNNVCLNLFGISDSYKATGLAMFLTVAMLVASILFIIVQSMNEFKTPFVHLVSTHSKPYLGMPIGCRYHIFVSHIWATGQDKVHKIVRMLKIYIKGVNIWLDVDVLKNLSDLEESVAESAHFILFYSKGYFKSTNCRREVVKAMDLKKPITVLFEPDDDISIDKRVQMKEEFEMFWPHQLNRGLAEIYIFEQDPIMWISKGLQFSLESTKLVTGRMLKCLPYYQKYPNLLNRGLKIKGEIEPIEMRMPLDILYCSTNIKAREVAQKLTRKCNGNVQVREMSISNTDLQENDNRAVMLVYLNKNTFKDHNRLLCDSIKCSLDKHIQVVLLHENDPNEGGCAFGEIMDQTPMELMEKPYGIYSNDIAVSLYSTKEYQEASMHLLLIKMGAQSIHANSIIGCIKGNTLPD